jgi:PAS domain-containing protein
MPIEHTIEELSRRLRESEQAVELLREKNSKLDTALNNMSQGLCMYDADARHVLCNGATSRSWISPPSLPRPVARCRDDRPPPAIRRRNR